MNVLLVEDELRVADFVRRGLKGEGWVVEHVDTGEKALDVLGRNAFDAVILDVMLPGISGKDVCRTMRAREILTPVLMLSALDAVGERVEGLRLGADDYLAKPFDFDELIARLTALVRRETQFRHRDDQDVLTHAGLTFDRRTLVTAVDGVPVELTAKERDILMLFLANPERPLTRERILSASWSTHEDPLTNVVDVYIGRLRRKLGRCGAYIRTVRGLGYRFTTDHQASSEDQNG